MQNELKVSLSTRNLLKNSENGSERYAEMKHLLVTMHRIILRDEGERMNDKVKLIVEISEGRYNEIMNKAKYICPTGLERVIANGIPLDKESEVKPNE